MQIPHISNKKSDPPFEETHKIAYRAIEVFQKHRDFEKVLERLFPLQNISKDNWLEGLIWREHGGIILLERGLKDIWCWEETKEAKEMLEIIDGRIR